MGGYSIFARRTKERISWLWEALQLPQDKVLPATLLGPAGFTVGIGLFALVPYAWHILGICSCPEDLLLALAARALHCQVFSCCSITPFSCT